MYKKWLDILKLFHKQQQLLYQQLFQQNLHGIGLTPISALDRARFLRSPSPILWLVFDEALHSATPCRAFP